MKRVPTWALATIGWLVLSGVVALTGRQPAARSPKLIPLEALTMSDIACLSCREKLPMPAEMGTIEQSCPCRVYPGGDVLCMTASGPMERFYAADLGTVGALLEEINGSSYWKCEVYACPLGPGALACPVL
jgi:hypothetical protein